MNLSLDISAFERPSQITEFVKGLKDRFLPLKFAYIGAAAYTHDQLIKSPSYHLADIESTLIRDRFYEGIISKLGLTKKVLNFVDIGSGNGLKAITILEVLFNGKFSVNYLALDYSQNLLDIVRKNIVNAFPDYNLMSTEVIDFENNPFAGVISKHIDNNAFSLFTLLGHTLGNPLDPKKALANIRKSMIDRNNCRFCLGVELFESTKVEEMLANYRNDAFHKAVFTPLTFIGLSPQDGLLNIDFNYDTRNVEVFFVFSQDVSVNCHSLGFLDFKKGDRILIFLSHRFSFDILRQDLINAKFEIQTTIVGTSTNYVLLLSAPV